MFNTPQEFNLNFHQGSDVDLGIGHQNTSTESASLGSYGRQLEVAISRGHTQPRDTRQPTYTHAVGNDFPGRERHSDIGIFPHSSNFDASYRDCYHDSFMTDPRNIERADGGSSVEQYYPGGTPMWAEQFELNSLPGSFSTHPSPGYIQHELPNATRRPQGHARRFPSDYVQVGHGNNLNNNAFAHSAPFKDHTSLTYPSWQTEPTSLIAETAPTPLQSPTPAHLFNAFGHHPPIGGSRRVPQMFKLTTAKRRHPGEKQPLSCLFYRERKIKCLQPSEDEPDQTIREMSIYRRVYERREYRDR
ncbi:hypothetical protein C8F04DRAFT_1139681 [Mycena alexandri]|uniref:Uncharacterized protein n=1 Tax=Mycena alexandri TaxID=1745969 RepID=A0AAD6WR09_9AGAR|nr:hypothetical protein C8F04DRAFT_1139681 [Mycena alexandri]